MTHKTSKIKLPSMTPGTGREVVVHRFGKRGARPKAYLQAAIHANELPGAMALHYLMPMLMDADKRGLIQGEIIVVPTVNPIGLAQLSGNNHLGRYDFLGLGNFNRNWLDLSDAVATRVGNRLGKSEKDNVKLIRSAALATLGAMKPVGELQTLRVEVMKLAVDADIVLDLHCDQDAALHMFISRRDWPHPAQALAADLGAEATLYNDPYPQGLTFSGVNGALWSRLADRFPDAAIAQACHSTTVELRGQADVSHPLGESDAGNLYRHLVRRGVIKGRAGKLPPLRNEATPMGGMDMGHAPCAGILVYHLPKGARVKKGQVICDVIDPSDPRGPRARKPVVARTDGVFYSGKQNGKLVWPGAPVFAIAGAKLLAHRKGLTNLDD